MVEQESVDASNLEFQQHYRNLSAPEKVVYLNDQINKSVINMDKLIDGMLQKQEVDFISAYRVLVKLSSNVGSHAKSAAGVAAG
jgi:hypothetical protein